MKIFYVTNARIPTEKAHGLATVKLCEAFVKAGAEVTLFIPWRINPLKDDPYTYYDVVRNFKIKRLPSVDFLWLAAAEKAFFTVQLFSFSLVAVLWLLLRYGIWGKLRNVIIFSHDSIPLYFLSFFASNIVYDIHHWPEHSTFYRRILKKARLLAVQTKWKVAKLGEDFQIPADKILYWPNGTDVDRFDIKISADEARDRLGLPKDKKLVIYTGQLFRWKGVGVLVEAARFFAGDTLVYVVGGSDNDIKNFQFQISNFQRRNVVFAGQKPWQEIPLWLKAADALVLPNTGREKVSRYYTSPMKLFEYMASGRPIVASDIPSIREVVDGNMVSFFRADDAKDLSEVVRWTLNNREGVEEKARKALIEVQKYTWQKRAEIILGRLTLIV